MLPSKRTSKVLTGHGLVDSGAAKPHCMLLKPDWIQEEPRVFQYPVPALYLSHFCVFWAILDASFAEDDDARTLCEVRGEIGRASCRER